MLNRLFQIATIACSVLVLSACSCLAIEKNQDHMANGSHVLPQPADSMAATSRKIPSPMPSHPGNVFLLGEDITIPVPAKLAGKTQNWQASDDRQKQVASGTCASANANAKIPLGKLGVGWYKIDFLDASGKTVGFTTAAVLRPLTACTPFDSPVCIDIASAWFAGAYGADARKHQQYYASLAALAGVNWVRDRMRWADLEPKQGVFTGDNNYDASATAQAAQGLNVLQVFHNTPPWAVDVAADGKEASKRFPRDLRHEYRFCKAMAERYKGRVLAWEPWNEANIDGFGGHLANEMCALQKAAYLGFKAGNPDLVVCWNAFAGAGSTLQTRNILDNETWPYYDTYDIHSYDPTNRYLSLFATAREAACGRPLWLSECGIAVPWKTERPWSDMTPENDLKQACFVAKSYASTLFSGVDRHFFFILGNYRENQTQFGLMRYDHTPRPGYVALAAVGRLLAGATSLGRAASVDGKSACVYAFSARPDGVAKDVLVAWSDKKTAWPGTHPQHIEAVFDYLGRKIGDKLPDALQPEPIFVLLPAGTAQRAFTFEPPAAKSPWRDGKPSPIVLQLQENKAAANLATQAYKRTAGASSPLSFCVYNFSNHRVSGTVAVEKIPASWRIEPSTWTVDLKPMDRLQLTGNITLPTASRDLVFGHVVTLRGDFGTEGRPVLAFNLNGDLAAIKPTTAQSIASAALAKNWKDNIVGGAAMSHKAAADGIQFDMKFGTSDPWAYPSLLLAKNERPTDDMDGFAFTLQVAEGHGTMRVQFVKENGACYIAEIPVDMTVRTPQRIVCLFSTASWASWSKPDPENILRPSHVRKVMVGINAKKNAKVTYTISNPEWVKF